MSMGEQGSQPDDQLGRLRVALELQIQGEEVARRQLDLARQLDGERRRVCQQLAQAVGLTDPMIDTLAASAREVTSAELAVASAVESREATEMLIADLERRIA